MNSTGKPIVWKGANQASMYGSINELFHSFNVINGLQLCRLSRGGLVVAHKKATDRKIRNHLIQHRTEMGGLLIGSIYKIEIGTLPSYVVVVTNSVPANNPESTLVSLKLGPDAWITAGRMCGDNEMVIGWYHSHPGFGAFFSSTDKKTQRDFFNQPFNIGVVVDPFRNEKKWFYGKDSTSLQNLYFLKNRGWANAQSHFSV